MNYWFTSDWHLFHESLRRKLPRPFKDIQKMNEVIISNFYNCVRPGDIVYIAGDISWDRKGLLDFLSKKPRNIHIHYIMGNHDKKIVNSEVKKYFESCSWLKDVKIYGQKITIQHYIMSSWNCSHYNAWHLFGHHHDVKSASNCRGKSMPLCVDLHNYKMLSFEQVKEYMDLREDNWDLVKK